MTTQSKFPQYNVYKELALTKMENYCRANPESRGCVPNMKNSLYTWMARQGIDNEWYEQLWQDVAKAYKDVIAEFEAKPLSERVKAGKRGSPCFNQHKQPNEAISNIGRCGLLDLIKEHKATCRGHCDISFIVMRIWLEELGVKFTDEEKALFV